MIEINLLSPELKVKGKKFDLKSIKLKHPLYVALLLLGLLICLHICLVLLGIVKHYQFNMLNKKWQNLKPQIKILEEFNKEHKTSLIDVKAMQKLITERINWAEKLNKLSLSLPNGVWFNDLSLSKNELILKGSVISLQKEELGLINQFMNNLKNDAGFFKAFNQLELGSAQRKTISGYDIVEFVLKGTLK